MRVALSRFADILRREGLRVSSGELIDAGRALDSIDLADRDMLHAALRATLAKRKNELERFDTVFNKFFAPPTIRASTRKKRRRQTAGDDSVPGESTTQGEAGRGRRQEPRDAARGLRAQRREVVRKLAGRRRESTEKRYPCSVITAPHNSRVSAGVAGREPARRRITEGPREHHTTSVVRKPFRERWRETESDALSRHVARILARLRIRRSRRGRVARRGSLWVQRIVRTNVGNDGVPFRLVRRRRVRKEPCLLLLVDVSHSVARAAATFLALAANLNRSFRSVRAYVFVDRAVDVSRRLPQFARINGRVELLDDIIAEFPEINPMALSDYGRVLFQVSELERRRIRKDTVCLILGDARANRFDPCAWSLELLKERARRVIWLVPEPLREWDRGDSVVREYAPHCDAICETADLEGLRFAMERVLRP